MKNANSSNIIFILVFNCKLLSKCQLNVYLSFIRVRSISPQWLCWWHCKLADSVCCISMSLFGLQVQLCIYWLVGMRFLSYNSSPVYLISLPHVHIFFFWIPCLLNSWLINRYVEFIHSQWNHGQPIRLSCCWQQHVCFWWILGDIVLCSCNILNFPKHHHKHTQLLKYLILKFGIRIVCLHSLMHSSSVRLYIGFDWYICIITCHEHCA